MQFGSGTKQRRQAGGDPGERRFAASDLTMSAAVEKEAGQCQRSPEYKVRTGWFDQSKGVWVR